ncbi:DNA translocase FtsK [Flavobacteriaceae bacterium Ap0902]|nr:DNA translocase FtsK [Flavobacteriaceae bacterium Ap0902]
MALKKKTTPAKPKGKINKTMLRMVSGVMIFFIGLIFLLSFISYLLSWKVDQSHVHTFNQPAYPVTNILGKLGVWLGDTFIFKGLGAAALLIAIWLMILGFITIFKKRKFPFFKVTLNILFFLIWIPLFFSFAFPGNPILGGRMGFEINAYLMDLIDFLGIILVLCFSFLIFAILEWRLSPEKFVQTMKDKSNMETEVKNAEINPVTDPIQKKEAKSRSKIYEDEPVLNVSKDKPISQKQDIGFNKDSYTDEELAPHKIEKPAQHSSSTTSPMPLNLEIEEHRPEPENIPETSPTIKEIIIEPHEEDEVSMTVEAIKEEEMVEENLSTDLVKKYGQYDPRLDLPKYKFPSIDLLKDYKSGHNINIDKEELEVNKNKIVETLNNYGINISSIKASIGPTVTLYEIIPEAGVRISKIKNLEDDIALSLSALGIRIIAPIPGKGTIGIEVPNSNPTIVSMRSVIASQRFQKSDMELPIALGKTISNETFIADLAKMPHMLMAGATGQGKSVGINAIITSLLYKKHPSELKFVMVDPKKVELALYNKIERHFLAKLPDTEDAIITDNQKVINTLNSLCIEMDDRYDLLKDAYVRNIKEYNEKFKARKLNPENGHKFMPYIVLVVDEFADLIMTAGKEVEQPIARLAQLARAVGIHLIIATQRPSVNVITGIIKANFPARAAYRVTSKVDSRTILDSGGADQLIGKGDMLYTKGNDLIRLQCAFVDTAEVDEIADYIGSQKGYADAYLLPEYVGEEGGSGDPLDVDPNDRDSLFDDAARVIVASQSGSASLLQRKLKIGYNRAGRIIDQLEANGIVGPFEGSKARDVLIQDEQSLEQILNNQD